MYMSMHTCVCVCVVGVCVGVCCVGVGVVIIYFSSVRSLLSPTSKPSGGSS